MICTCKRRACAPHPRLGRIVVRVRDEKCLEHGTMLDGLAAAASEVLDQNWTEAATKRVVADEPWEVAR